MENVSPIFEASFKKDDWLKQNHTYAADVISALINGEKIKLGDKQATGEFQANAEEIEQLKNFEPQYTVDSLNAFDAIFNGRLKWSQIYKGAFSGHDSGQSVGEIFESLVCYLFNDDNADIEAWATFTNAPLSDDWVKSSRATVEAMNKFQFAGYKWDNKNYIACHVDGHDFRPSGNKFAYDITSIFKGKADARKIMGVNCNDMYAGGKDTWNKADIVLVHRDAVNLIDEMKKVVIDGQTLNNELLVHLADGMIIPVSLKKVVDADKVKIEGYNIDEAKEMEGHNIEDVVELKIADKFPAGDFAGTIYMVCKALDGKPVIQFRKNTNKGNGLSVEGQMGRLARAGKALSNIKNALGLKNNNDYYVVRDTNEEALEELKSYGVNVSLKHNSNWNDVHPEFRERACVAGLIGLLREYQKKLHPQKDNDFIKDFANFCWLCATKGSGAFFKLYQ